MIWQLHENVRSVKQFGGVRFFPRRSSNLGKFRDCENWLDFEHTARIKYTDFRPFG
jgi:hypothetical protein